MLNMLKITSLWTSRHLQPFELSTGFIYHISLEKQGQWTVWVTVPYFSENSVSLHGLKQLSTTRRELPSSRSYQPALVHLNVISLLLWATKRAQTCTYSTRQKFGHNYLYFYYFLRCWTILKKISKLWSNTHGTYVKLCGTQKMCLKMYIFFIF